MAGETTRHRNLKRAALVWAQTQGYPITATEIRAPRSNYRVDVAAYRPPSGNTPELGTVFECKQARPDFLKDRHALEETLARFQDLNHRRQRIENQLAIHFPTLRQGDALFPEYESIDLSTIQHATYHKILRELNQLQHRIYGRTKFDRMVRWQCANLFYLVAPPGILETEELPAAWGLLSPAGAAPLDKIGVCAGELTLHVIRPPTHVPTPPDVPPGEWLQRIARAATRLTNQAEGIDGDTLWKTGHSRPRHTRQ